MAVALHVQLKMDLPAQVAQTQPQTHEKNAVLLEQLSQQTKEVENLFVEMAKNMLKRSEMMGTQTPAMDAAQPA